MLHSAAVQRVEPLRAGWQIPPCWCCHVLAPLLRCCHSPGLHAGFALLKGEIGRLPEMHQVHLQLPGLHLLSGDALHHPLSCCHSPRRHEQWCLKTGRCRSQQQGHWQPAGRRMQLGLRWPHSPPRSCCRCPEIPLECESWGRPSGRASCRSTGELHQGLAVET